ncbi:hypothetical protein HYV91_01195 [Candidatus Wolfebacteria bacterium]|nr:hypothetical protein [Candidatus Wolfebacteria bacterium]
MNMEQKSLEKIPQRDSSAEKLPDNISVIETSGGKFRVIYGDHRERQKPEDLGESAVALMLETAGLSIDYSEPKQAEEFFSRLSQHFQYKKIIEKVQRENKPIFLGDITDAEAVLLLRQLLKTGETIAAPLLFSLLACMLSGRMLSGRKEISRRDLLKNLSIALPGIYFSTQTAQLVPGLIRKLRGKYSPLNLFRKIMIDINERLHPETDAILLTLRNYILAQKLKTIAQKLSKGVSEKPEIAIVVGANHMGIERALRENEWEGLTVINKSMHAPSLKKAKEKIATIARFDFDKNRNKWMPTEIFKDPYLAEVEAQNS